MEVSAIVVCTFRAVYKYKYGTLESFRGLKKGTIHILPLNLPSYLSAFEPRSQHPENTCINLNTPLEPDLGCLEVQINGAQILVLERTIDWIRPRRIVLPALRQSFSFFHEGAILIWVIIRLLDSHLVPVCDSQCSEFITACLVWGFQVIINGLTTHLEVTRSASSPLPRYHS